MVSLSMNWKGILFAAGIGLLAYLAAPYIPAFNAIILGLLIGILIGNFSKLPSVLQPGIKFTGSKMLELSILFLAFSINFSHIVRLGWESFVIIVIMIIALLLLTVFLAIRVKCPHSIGWLVGFGTAICGSSAIAAVAPGITKNKDDVGIAMAVVNLMGSIGMLLLPLAFVYLPFSDIETGLLLGGSLHAVGNVAGAAYALSDSVGEAAITIKLARVAMLSPAVIFFTWLINKNEPKNLKQHLNLPYYLWGFILITLLTTFIDFPKEFLSWMDATGKLVLTIAMTAIGLNVSFKTLFLSGRKALGFGVLIFAIQLMILFSLIFIFKAF